MPLLATPRWWDGGTIVARRGRQTLSIAVKGGVSLARRRRRRWEDLAPTTSKRSVGSGGQGGDNDGDVDPRGDDYNDTTISLAMATATRLAGDKECDGGKSDGYDEKGCGRATAMAPKRAVAAATRAMVRAARVMATPTKRAMAAATRGAGDEEGDVEGGKSDGDAYEEGDGGGDEGGGRQ